MADAKEFESVNTTPPAYNEKIEDSTTKHDEFPDTGRRQSVALNIVENPLKVRVTLSFALVLLHRAKCQITC